MIGLLLAREGCGPSRDSVPSTDWLKTLPQQPAVSVAAAGVVLTTESGSANAVGRTSGAAENQAGGAESLPTRTARPRATETRGTGAPETSRAPNGNCGPGWAAS